MSKLKSVKEIKAGWDKLERPKDGQVFEHYKGGRYVIVGTGFLEDTEAPCVIYKSLEKNIIWVRTAKNFLEEIEYNGEMIPRFRPITQDKQRLS
jgi:hypothetical protein